jgi:hypothetical protein
MRHVQQGFSLAYAGPKAKRPTAAGPRAFKTVCPESKHRHSMTARLAALPARRHMSPSLDNFRTSRAQVVKKTL